MAPLALIACLATALGGQVITGTVRESGTKSIIAGVTITLTDSSGVTVDETRSDELGGFRMDGQHVAKLRFLVRKLGVEPTITALLDNPADADTLRVDLSAPVIGVTLATLRVVSTVEPTRNFNGLQLQSAKRSGWRVIEPYRLVDDRSVVSTLGDLLRRNPIPGVRPPRGAVGCYRYARSNACLTLVVDGQVVGPDAFVSPTDVHFIAFLTATQAAMQYGARAREGAIFIATRRRGDDERPPKID